MCNNSSTFRHPDGSRPCHRGDGCEDEPYQCTWYHEDMPATKESAVCQRLPHHSELTVIFLQTPQAKITTQALVKQVAANEDRELLAICPKCQYNGGVPACPDRHVRGIWYGPESSAHFPHDFIVTIGTLIRRGRVYMATNVTTATCNVAIITHT